MPAPADPSGFSRRSVLAGLGAYIAAQPAAVFGAGFSPLAAVRALRIAAGPLAGAFTIAPLGVVNWYFGNVGLLPFAARLPGEVRAWLDLQIARYDTRRGTIADVEPDYATGSAAPGIKRLLLSDSDDAYAGTLLALAARHDALGADDVWWNANVGALKAIARSGIRALQKPSGLTRTFRSHARPGADLAYLMDNCEVWSGLAAFAARLAARGDRTGAAVHARAAQQVAGGIAGLFDPDSGAFRPADSGTAPGTAFYPDATAQVFPELHGVIAPSLGQAQYDAGWAALGRFAPQWPALAYDSYPWLLLGTVAARRGAAGRRLARLQLAAARSLPAARLTINELGYWQRTADLLRA